jgi:hypothetical protein
MKQHPNMLDVLKIHRKKQNKTKTKLISKVDAKQTYLRRVKSESET